MYVDKTPDQDSYDVLATRKETEAAETLANAGASAGHQDPVKIWQTPPAKMPPLPPVAEEFDDGTTAITNEEERTLPIPKGRNEHVHHLLGREETSMIEYMGRAMS